jgi:hypothetical protein
MLASTVDQLLHHDTYASLKATRCGSASHLGQGDAPDLTSGANLMGHWGALVTTRGGSATFPSADHSMALDSVRSGASLAARTPPTTAGLRQVMICTKMSKYACRQDLPSDPDQRRHVALARDVGSRTNGTNRDFDEPCPQP